MIIKIIIFSKTVHKNTNVMSHMCFQSYIYKYTHTHTHLYIFLILEYFIICSFKLNKAGFRGKYYYSLK